MEKRRQKCEIYSRVVGFLSPVSQWNVGKKSEFLDRKTYDQALNTSSNQMHADSVLQCETANCAR